MLKQSLIAAVIVGCLAASASAEGTVEVGEEKQILALQDDFAFEAPKATCAASPNATDAQELTLRLMSEQNQSPARIEGTQVAGRWTYSYCIICTFICRLIRC